MICFDGALNQSICIGRIDRAIGIAVQHDYRYCARVKVAPAAGVNIDCAVFINANAEATSRGSYRQPRMDADRGNNSGYSCPMIGHRTAR